MKERVELRPALPTMHTATSRNCLREKKEEDEDESTNLQVFPFFHPPTPFHNPSSPCSSFSHRPPPPPLFFTRSRTSFPFPPLCVNDGLDTKENSRIATRHTTAATERPSGKNQEEKENLFPGRINRSGGERVEKG